MPRCQRCLYDFTEAVPAQYELDSFMVECQRHFQHQRRVSAISTFYVQSGVVRITNGVQCGTWLVERCFSDKPRVVMRLVAWSGAVSFRAQTCWTGESVNVTAESHVSMLRSFREVLISSMRGFLSPAALESTFLRRREGSILFVISFTGVQRVRCTSVR